MSLVRAVRGYKNEEGMMNGLELTQWAWSDQEGLDPGELIDSRAVPISCSTLTLSSHRQDLKSRLARLRGETWLLAMAKIIYAAHRFPASASEGQS